MRQSVRHRVIGMSPVIEGNKKQQIERAAAIDSEFCSRPQPPPIRGVSAGRVDNGELWAAHAGIVGVGRAGACERAHAVFVEPACGLLESLALSIDRPHHLVKATVTRFCVFGGFHHTNARRAIRSQLGNSIKSSVFIWTRDPCIGLIRKFSLLPAAASKAASTERGFETRPLFTQSTNRAKPANLVLRLVLG